MKRTLVAFFLLLCTAIFASQYWVVGEVFTQTW